ncbi:positive regulator of sigma E, RseC/MucC [Sulfuricella sp. T08]|uniref:SoxR reducing system RseC family protein n=1 Tax=Sulfuricella sp. T08 TaxID=1632857 RepID=UPI0006179C7D|nr:SoxR reducing system RseC family protein [Sulfuricella sp. T08]GAO36272.1 positive regulator of sigma E, RseC/MucC [Sulfuricella sp. T08]
MIETEAVVVKIEHAVAYVQAERKSNCSSCSESSCGTSVLANFFGKRTPLYRASNEVGAKVGDRVVVGLNESALFKGTLLLYLFPLLLLFVGAVAGSVLAVTADVKDGYSVAGACIGLAAGFLGLKLFSSKMGLARQFQPVILSRMVDMPVSVVNFESGLKK